MSGLQVSIEKKVYDNGVCTIEGLEIAADPAEFVAIVGPSGAGKTTLLNIVAGLDRNMQGHVHLEGRALHDRDAERPRIGFMFQDARLMPWLTVRENVELVMAQNEQAAEEAHRLLGQVGLNGFEDAFPGQLSGGMRRRAALARAFAVHPALMLLDEPFQSLDAPTADSLRALLLELWARTQPIVLFVTHSLREALAMADRVVFLSGRPACTVMEYKVGLARPRAVEDPAVNELHDLLLREHPRLLSGLVADEGVVSLRGNRVISSREVNA